MNGRPAILVYGVGNPGREDDGLGIRFAEWAAGRGFPGVRVDSNYQLNAEDALAVSACDVVVFADASVNAIGGFRLSVLEPAAEIAFTTHAMPPGAILALCRELYAKSPAGFLLEIQGSRWGFAEGISGPAEQRLAEACAFMAPLLEKREAEAFSKAACRWSGRSRRPVPCGSRAVRRAGRGGAS